jgi:mono/diheme cytochrome c family protein
MLKQSRTVMPHFAGQLNADEAKQILTYLRTLPQGSTQEGVGQ